jgi:hypothetical protein
MAPSTKTTTPSVDYLAPKLQLQPTPTITTIPVQTIKPPKK